MNSAKERLTRSSSDKIFAGVLGGLAEHYNLNAFWLRLGVTVAFFATTGVVFIGYIAAAIVIPKPDDDQNQANGNST